jgi:hypothetical protein
MPGFAVPDLRPLAGKTDISGTATMMVGPIPASTLASAALTH